MTAHTTLTPEILAKQFRIWRSAHRPNLSVAELSKETQIPTKRLIKLLQGADVLAEFSDHIQWFLEAFEQENTNILTLLREGKLPKVLPPAHVPQSYPTAIRDLLLIRQQELTEDAAAPYCIIAAKEVSNRQCLASQNASGCFGCGAESVRFCAVCQFERIAFAGSELCTYCLSVAITDPTTDTPSSAFASWVTCPISGGQDISVKTCRRMQGDACGKCDAVTRVCVECKTRRVRYASCGMCLKCYHMMMNPSWQPLRADAIESEKKRRDMFFNQKLVPPTPTLKPKTIVITVEQPPATFDQPEQPPDSASGIVTIQYEFHLSIDESSSMIHVFGSGAVEQVPNAFEAFGGVLSMALWQSGYFLTTSTRTGKTRINTERLHQTRFVVHAESSLHGRTRFIHLGDADQFKGLPTWWLEHLQREHSCAMTKGSSHAVQLSVLQERITQHRQLIANLTAKIREDEIAIDAILANKSNNP